MHIWRPLLLLAACALLADASACADASASATAVAQAADPFSQVRAFIEQGRYDDARAFAVAFGKTPAAKAANLAFINGLILQHEGKLAEAAKVFRDLLVRSPEFDLVRIELARTLYMMGDYEGAQHHFEILYAAARVASERDLYDRFLADIRSKRPWTFDAYVDVAPSTNINNGLDSDVVVIGGVPFSGATAKQSGVGLGVGVDGSYRFDLSSHVDLTLGGAISSSVYTAPSYDDLALQSFAELAYMAQPWRAGVALAGQRTFVGWDGYSWGLGPQFSLKRDFGRAGTLLATASWQALSYDTQPAYDGSQTAFGLKYTYAFSASAQGHIGAEVAHVTAAVPFNAYNSWRAEVGGYRELRNGYVVDAHVAFEERNFLADFPLTGAPRQDQLWEFAAGLTLTRWTAWGLAPRLEYSYRQTASNVGLFDTSAQAVTLTLAKQY